MHTLNQRPLCGATALLNIIGNDPFGDFVLSVPTTQGSARLEVLVPKWDTPLQRDIARLLLLQRTQPPSGYFGLLMI